MQGSISGAASFKDVWILANEYSEGGQFVEAYCDNWGSMTDQNCYLNSSTQQISAAQWDQNAYRARVSGFSDAGGSKTITFYLEQMMGGGGPTFLNSSNTNVSMALCAMDFSKPMPKPVAGVVLTNVTVTAYQPMAPPQTTELTVYNIGTGIAYIPPLNVSFGPSGCLGFKMIQPGGWSSTMGPAEVQATVKRLSDNATETSWVTQVFVCTGGCGPGG